MKSFWAPVALLSALATLLGSGSRAAALEPLMTHVSLGTFLHPIQEPETLPCPEGRPFRREDYRMEHVHIFTVNGFNSLCTGNFNGLCAYLRKQGFQHTYFSQLYTLHGYAKKIPQILKEDPEARIVLIGFSWGCNDVRRVANALGEDGTPIDLLVYLAGDCIGNDPSSFPKNVRRVVNVRARGLILLGGDLLLNGADIDGARNLFLDVRHILVPSRKQTLTWLMEELLLLSSKQP